MVWWEDCDYRRIFEPLALSKIVASHSRVFTVLVTKKRTKK